MLRWFDDNFFRITIVMNSTLFVVVGVLTFFITQYGPTHHRIGNEDRILNEGYVQVLPEGDFAVDLPSDLDVIDGKVVLRHEVTSSLAQKGGIGFRVENTYVKVFFGEELLFSNHREDGRLAENGMEWVHFDLNSYRGGVEELVIELTPVNVVQWLYVDSVYVGNQQEIFSMALMMDWQRYVVVVLLLTLGCFVLFFRYIYNKAIGLNNSVGILGIGSIGTAMGIFCTTNIVAFDFMSGHTLKVFIFVAMMLSVTSIAGYAVQIDTLKNRRMILGLMGLNISWAVVFLLTNLAYPRVFLLSERIFTITLVLGTLIYCLYQVAEDVRLGNSSARVLLASLLLLVVLALAESIFHYGFKMESPRYAIIGIILFFLLNTAHEIRETANHYEWAGLMNYYKELARTDKMTGLKNRVCLVEDLAQHNRMPRNLMMIFLDIDNLKRVNDSYGHAMGDDMIVTTADLITKCFTPLGDCYRISGDEFVCLTAQLEAAEMEIVRFRQEVAAMNEEKVYRYRVALGFATFDPMQDKSLEDTMSRAENEMYEDKRSVRMEYRI